MPRPRQIADEDAAPVMVPRNDKDLVATAPERIQRLREHLIKTLRELRTAKRWESSESPMPAHPSGFAARVADAACSLCKGWCCRNGDDDAYLDASTLARVRLVRPGMTERATLHLYLDRVPPVVYRNSCIFHGKNGCTLDRALRADICNSYFCGGLDAFMRTPAETPARIIAGEGERMRTSPVLTP